MLPMTDTVLIMDPRNPVSGSAIKEFSFIFLKRIHSQPAPMPISMRQPTAIQRALMAPTIPVVLMNGEKAKDRRVGAMVLEMTEQIPKTNPRMAPAVGPKIIAPRITGMWTVVALIIGSCIIPSGVLASTITMAAISAIQTMCRVSYFLFIFSFPPCCYHSLRGIQHNKRTIA